MVWGLLAGMVASAFWDAVLLWFRAGKQRTIFEPAIGANTQGNRVWTWIIIILLIDSLAQVFTVVDRFLGSYLTSGAIASLNYASLVVGVSTAIVASTLSTAIFPFLSDAHAEQDRRRTFEIVDRAVTWAVILSVPVTVWALAFSGPIVSILFERGAFDASARTLTSHALAGCSVGVLPIALAAIWARLFYAAQRWKPILATSLISISVKTVCAFWWVSEWGVVGLALSGSAAQIAAATFIAWHERHVLKEGLRRWGAMAGKVLVLVGLPAVPFAWFISRAPGAGTLTHSLLALGGTVVGVLLLIGVGRRWGISEMNVVWGILTRSKRQAT
jgi:putative peptidoglycan lipid II flippase